MKPVWNYQGSQPSEDQVVLLRYEYAWQLFEGLRWMPVTAVALVQDNGFYMEDNDVFVPFTPSPSEFRNIRWMEIPEEENQ